MDHDRSPMCCALLRGALGLLCCCLFASNAVADARAVASATPDSRILRVIKLNDFALNSHRASAAVQIAMVRDFARAADMEIEWVEVFRAQEALERLLDGRGDLSISAVPVDYRFDERLLATEPLGLQRFRVIGKQSSQVSSPLDLNNRSIAVALSSPMWPYLKRLQTVVPTLRLEVVPDDLRRDDLLRMVSEGTYDTAVLNTEFGEPVVAEFPRLKSLFDLSSAQPISWFASVDDSALIERLNGFIKRYHTAYDRPERRLRTFADVKRQGILRVITRLDGTNYFLKRGRPAGFELGLARRFAAHHGLRLEVLVGRDDSEVTEWLRHGVGDIVTTRVNASEIRGEPGFKMSREYFYDASVLVSNWTQPLRSFAQLGNRNIAAYTNSAHLEALEEFVGPDTGVIRVAERVTLSQVLDRVEEGLVDGAVIDSAQLDSVLAAHPDLVVGMSIPNPYRYRWTLRGNDRRLADAVDDFLQNEYRKEAYNVLELQNKRAKKSQQLALYDISPFDELLQSYAERFDFDWRLIAAQMYQESKFDPSAVSSAGAEGLMQLMPSTAAAVGVANPLDPEAGIRGGLQYLNNMRERFESRVPMNERTWFALAAYNIGYDRVRRARNRAREAGLNPNKWFGNVESAMRELARAGDNGGCRCGQAVVYVRAIRSLYYAYRNLELAVRVPRNLTAAG